MLRWIRRSTERAYFSVYPVWHLPEITPRYRLFGRPLEIVKRSNLVFDPQRR